MTPNLMSDTLCKIAMNLLNVTLDDKIQNPYLKATLSPLIDTFLNGVLDGVTGDEMARRFSDVSGAESSPDQLQQLGGFLDQATLNA